MNRLFPNFLRVALICAVAAVLLAGCSKKDDPIDAAAKQDTQAGIAAPGIAETKAIAEEGFIYGLPIVMNYAVMYEFVVDKNSGQYKAPFNTINNEARVFTYKDTAVVTPNSDTPYSMLWLDLRAEPMVISVPAVEKKRYYSVQLIDGNTYNYGYIGSRATGNEAGDYLVVGPGLEGRDAGRDQEGVPVVDAVRAHHLPHPALQCRGHAERGEGASRLQGPAAVRVSQAARAACRAEDRFLPATTAGIKENFFEYLDAALQFVPPSAGRQGRFAPGSPRIGIGPGKTFEFKDLSLEHKAAVLLGMKEGETKVDEYLADRDEEHQRLESRLGSSAIALSSMATGCMRAAAAKGGIYGNDAVEAMYPMTRMDATGEPLDGSKHNYTLTFRRRPAAAGQRLLVGDDVRRQEPAADPESDQPLSDQLADAAGHEEERRRLADALHPEGFAGRGEGTNWLPAPNGDVYLVMRLYWPKTAPSILPPGEGTGNRRASSRRSETEHL